MKHEDSMSASKVKPFTSCGYCGKPVRKDFKICSVCREKKRRSPADLPMAANANKWLQKSWG